MSRGSIDKSNMRQVILDFPKQFPVGLGVAKDVKIKGEFKNIILCGMGGSALPGEILKTYLQKLEIGNWKLEIHKDYGLPSQTDKNSLVVCISYSGNTEETISSYQEATRRRLPIVAITAGGKLAELCQKNKTPWVKTPKTGIQPRSAVGYQLASLFKVLSNSGIIKNRDREILKMAENLKPEESEKPGKELAKKLVGKIPIIYSSITHLAFIWKIIFNENSKIHAFWNYFPELNHNELVGYTKPQGKYHIIILRDKKLDRPRILKRMELTADLIKSKGIGVNIIDLGRQDILTKIFSNIILANWTSYYLALEYGVDPTPVEIVEEFKKGLSH